MIESTCRACDATAAQRHIAVREMMFGTREVFDYAECSTCKSLQIVTVPDDLSRFYPTQYTCFQRQTAPNFSPAVDWLKQRLLVREAGYELSNSGLVGRLVKRL